MLLVFLSYLHLWCVGAKEWNGARPHIIALMIDDLGHYDTQVNNPNSPSPFIGLLAHEEGMVLERHYVYMYCSPTRRSFLTGRFPTSIQPHQASTCSNYVPRNLTWISQKLEKAGYMSHFVGKGHLGYPTTGNLPINRGYASHIGYLGGAEPYDMANAATKDFWADDHPAEKERMDSWYSTNFFSSQAVKIINAHDKTKPLFLDLRYQGVHGPYVNPPEWEQVPNTTANNRICGPTYSCQILESMVKVVDDGIRNVTRALKATGIWDNALIVYFADNGGGAGSTEPSNNYPLRGTKAEPWEGAVRVQSFVSGGFLPDHLKGTRNTAFMHVADWFPTFANLAGVDSSDDAYYNGTIHPIDGLDLWPVLLGEQERLDRMWLPTTNSSIIFNSTWKLITAAPSTHWSTQEDDWIEDGWTCKASYPRNDSQTSEWICMVCTWDEPCLFNIISDPQERNDVASDHPSLVDHMKEGMVNIPGIQRGRCFPPYTGEDLTPAEVTELEAEGFQCLGAQQAAETWWDGYIGPCCKKINEKRKVHHVFYDI